MEFEGVKLDAYRDIGGLPTIGYGHTQGVVMGQSITQAQAVGFLASDLIERELQVLRALSRDVRQNQFDAIISFVYNLGIGSFGRSDVRTHTNAGRFPQAADAFLNWNMSQGRPVAGLTRRRTAERAMYLLAPAAIAAAPIVAADPATAQPVVPVVVNHPGGLLGWLGL